MERIDKHLHEETAIQLLKKESYCQLCRSLMLEPSKLDCNHRFCVKCLKEKFDKVPKFMKPKCPNTSCCKQQETFDFKYRVDNGFLGFIKSALPEEFSK